MIKSDIRNTSFNVSSRKSLNNMMLINSIIEIIDKLNYEKKAVTRKLIKKVKDRKGHDRVYSISSSKLSKELGWTPQINIFDGLKDTISWYANLIQNMNKNKLNNLINEIY